MSDSRKWQCHRHSGLNEARSDVHEEPFSDGCALTMFSHLSLLLSSQVMGLLRPKPPGEMQKKPRWYQLAEIHIPPILSAAC